MLDLIISTNKGVKMEQKVKAILKRNLSDIYDICLMGFEEAKKTGFGMYPIVDISLHEFIQ